MKDKQRRPAYISTQVDRGRYAFPERDARISRRAHVVAAGCEHCLPAYRIERRDFPYYCLELVLDGAGFYTAGGARQALAPASIFLYGPGLAHRIECDPARPMVKYFVDFAGPGSRRLIRDAGLPIGAVFRAAKPQRLVDALEDLLRDGAENSPLSARMCASRVEYLLLRAGEDRMTPGSAQSRAYATFLRCSLVLEERCLALRNLSDVARACHVAPAYLCRLFQRYGRESPHQRLVRLKMGRAADRMASGGRLVKEVAAEIGYEDPYHFSKLFKRVYGLSPEQFRRRGARQYPGT